MGGLFLFSPGGAFGIIGEKNLIPQVLNTLDFFFVNYTEITELSTSVLGLLSVMIFICMKS